MLKSSNLLLVLAVAIGSTALGQVNTSLNLVSSNAATLLGQPVTFTVSIAPASAPGNFLLVSSRAGILGSGILLGGRGTVTTNLLPDGLNGVYAVYPGPPGFNSSVSNVLLQSVGTLKGGGFLPPLSVPLSNQPGLWGAARGDFNGDSISDLAVPNLNSQNVFVLLGAGDGTFTSQLGFAADNSPRKAVAIDIDLDGDQDIVVACLSLSQTVLQNNGAGAFSPITDLLLAGESRWADTADFNRDLVPDLVFAGNVPGTNLGLLTIRTGAGDSTFPGAVAVTTAETLERVITADLNNDGFPDIVALSQNRLVIVMNRGGTTFSLILDSSGIVNDPSALAVGDFDGDGLQDIAVADTFSERIQLLRNLGNEQFSPAVTALSGKDVRAMSVGDFNGDLADDLVVTNYGLNQISILYGRGNMEFGSPVAVPVSGSLPAQVLATELNGDGRWDIVTSNFSSQNLNIFLGSPAVQTSLVLAGPTSPVTQGQNVTFTATVSPTSAGVVTFLANGTVLGQSFVNAGAASFSTNQLPTGTHLISANFGGSDTSLPSKSAGVALEVRAQRSTGFGTPGIFTSAPDRAVSLMKGRTTFGLTDLVVAREGNPSAFTLRGNGNGTFQAPVSSLNIVKVRNARLADLDVDGRDDLILLALESAVIAQPSGNGDFEVRQTLPLAFDPLDVVAGDFNSDSRSDLVILGNGDKFQVWLGAVGGRFTPSLTYTLPAPARSIAGADFNRDLRLDLFIAGGDGRVYTYAGLAGGLFAAAGSLALEANSNPVAIAVGDVNLDGALDIVTASNNTSNLSFLRSTQTGTELVLLAIGENSTDVEIGDLNGDRRPDILAASNRRLVSLPNTGAGTFGTPVITNLTDQVTRLVLADFNSDGLTDAAALAESGRVHVVLGVPPAPTSTTLQTSANPAVLGASVTLTAAVSPSAATGLVTFFANGQPLGSAPLTGGSAQFTLRSLPSGTLRLTATYSGASGFFGSSSPALTQNVQSTPGLGLGAGPAITLNPASARSTSGAIGDFNGDGFTDFAATDEAANLIRIFLGSAGGNFAASSFNLLTAPGAIVAADFNRDGRLDLAVAGGEGVIGLFFGNGAGAFANALPIQASNSGAGLVAADFNADGAPDLLVPAPDRLTVLFNSGLGTLLPPQTILTDVAPAALASGDFNGDGFTDIALSAGLSSGSVRILLGSANGTFQDSANIPLASAALHLSVGDLDRDGKLEIAAAMPGANQIALLRGLGNGTFSPLTPLNLTGALRTAWSDFNGDGFIDLAASAKMPEVRVFYGDGSGAFSTPVNINASGAPSALLAGEFNRDGRADLLSLSSSTNVNNVLLGQALIGLQVTLAATPGITGINQPVSLTATLNPAAATGQVVFYSGASILGRAPVTGGSAQLTARISTSGLRRLQARYLGSAVFEPTNSNTVNLSVTAAPSTSYSPPVRSGAFGNSIMSFTAADFTGDGRPDLAIGALQQSTLAIQVYTGAADGTYTAGQQLDVRGAGCGIPGPFGPVDVADLATADINEDGRQDLVSISDVLSCFSVFLGNGDGTFQAARSTAAAGRSVGLADVNLDGKWDIVTGGSGTIQVFLGDGSGAFTPVASFPAGTSSLWRLRMERLNGDLIPDIAFITSTGQVGVVLGLPGGGFGTPAVTNVASGLFYLQLADLTGDASPDLLASNASTIYVFANDQAGGFTALPSITPAAGGFAGDNYTGNSALDLAFATNQNIGIARGLGNGQFAAPVLNPLGFDFLDLLRLDINLDGRMDFLMPDLNSSQIVVVLGKL